MQWCNYSTTGRSWIACRLFPLQKNHTLFLFQCYEFTLRQILSWKIRPGLCLLKKIMDRESLFLWFLLVLGSWDSVVKRDGKGAPSKTIMINSLRGLDTLGRCICWALSRDAASGSLRISSTNELTQSPCAKYIYQFCFQEKSSIKHSRLFPWFGFSEFSLGIDLIPNFGWILQDSLINFNVEKFCSTVNGN